MSKISRISRIFIDQTNIRTCLPDITCDHPLLLLFHLLLLHPADLDAGLGGGCLTSSALGGGGWNPDQQPLVRGGHAVNCRCGNRLLAAVAITVNSPILTAIVRLWPDGLPSDATAAGLSCPPAAFGLLPPVSNSRQRVVCTLNIARPDTKS